MTRRSDAAIRDAELRPLPDVGRAFGLIVSVFDVLYLLATLPSFVQSAASVPTAAMTSIAVLVIVPVLAGGAAAAVGRMTRLRWVVAAACYPIALLVWSVTVVGPLQSTPPPWLLAMLIPVVLQVQAATRSLRATAIVTAALVGVQVVVATTRGGMPVAAAATDALIITPPAVLLATVLTLVSRAARRTGRAEQDALRRIAAARFDDVTEAERVRTDALLHDTVLTTLLQAASAQDDAETTRAARMAENAVRVLAHVGRTRDLGAGVRLRTAVSAHEERLAPLLESFEVTLDDRLLEDLLLPSDAADALLVALAEAMENSVRHADARRRTVRLRPLGPDGVRIEIDDDGRGFDPSTVDGTGLASRIMDGMLLVEGRAEVRSAPGAGTSVRLTWGSVSVADVRSPDARLQGTSR